MGMDVFGRKPKNETGEYFRNNVWWWHPLWEYCCVVAPDLCGKVECGHTNDGDGLNAKDSLALAKLLSEEIESGRTAAYEVTRAATLAALPDVECSSCNGSGTRTFGSGSVAVAEPCSPCKATGVCRPWETYYGFEVANVEEFAAFLENCGGFQIW